MSIFAEERIRRSAIEAYYADASKREVEEYSEIKQQAMAAFERHLDGKIKNLQRGEGLVISFYMDIVGRNGKIRGGSGAQRNMPEYAEWRTAVYERDGYVCQECGATGELNAHHIKSWASSPELRFEVDNGVTLCRDCHAKKHPHIGWLNA